VTIHLICWYLEGKLSPSVEGEIEKHLKDCRTATSFWTLPTARWTAISALPARKKHADVRLLELEL